MRFGEKLGVIIRIDYLIRNRNFSVRFSFFEGSLLEGGLWGKGF